MKHNCWNCEFMRFHNGMGECEWKMLSCSYDLDNTYQRNILKKINDCEFWAERDKKAFGRIEKAMKRCSDYKRRFALYGRGR